MALFFPQCSGWLAGWLIPLQGGDWLIPPQCGGWLADSAASTSCPTNEYYSSTILYYSSTSLYHSVLQSASLYYKVLLQYYPVLQSIRNHYSSSTPVLLQYYFVLQSTIPVLLCTTRYHKVLSSTILYDKVQLQYCSVFQSVCTTRCNPSTTPVLLQYYFVLQSTTPVLLCTTKCYFSTILYYKVSPRTTKYYSNSILYYKVTLMIDACHI